MEIAEWSLETSAVYIKNSRACLAAERRRVKVCSREREMMERKREREREAKIDRGHHNRYTSTQQSLLSNTITVTLQHHNRYSPTSQDIAMTSMLAP
jgi:hypothetical protein